MWLKLFSTCLNMGTSTVAQNSKIYSFDATLSPVPAPAPAPATEIIRDIAAPQHYSRYMV
jgi:hypothetical protein